jgi:hypothetical protein
MIFTIRSSLALFSGHLTPCPQWGGKRAIDKGAALGYRSLHWVRIAPGSPNPVKPSIRSIATLRRFGAGAVARAFSLRVTK